MPHGRQGSPPNPDQMAVAALAGDVDSLATVHVRWDSGKRLGVTAEAPPGMIRAAPDPGSADG